MSSTVVICPIARERQKYKQLIERDCPREKQQHSEEEHQASVLLWSDKAVLHRCRAVCYDCAVVDILRTGTKKTLESVRRLTLGGGVVQSEALRGRLSALGLVVHNQSLAQTTPTGARYTEGELGLGGQVAARSYSGAIRRPGVTPHVRLQGAALLSPWL